MSELIRFKLLQIDAWREPEGGWTWNQAICREEDIYISEELLTPRRITALLRRWDYLSPESAGRVLVDMNPEFVDGYLIEILYRNTREPLFALSTFH
jgi:hypothetical protein